MKGSSIIARLVLNIGLAVFFMVLLAHVTLDLSGILDREHRQLEARLTQKELVGRLKNQILDTSLVLHRILYQGFEDPGHQFEEKATSIRALYDLFRGNLLALGPEFEDEYRLASTYEIAILSLGQDFLTARARHRAGQDKEARVHLLGVVEPVREDILAFLTRFELRLAGQVNERLEKIPAFLSLVARTGLRWFLLFALLCILATAIVSWTISAPLTRLLSRIEGIIADQDLEKMVETSPMAPNEVQALSAAFNRLMADLRRNTVGREYVDNIIQSMHEALLVLGPNGRLKSLNPATLRLFEKEPSELLDRPADELLRPIEISDTSETENLTMLVERGELVNRPYFILGSGDEKVPISLSGSITWDRHQACLVYVLVAVDSRDRLRSEEALKKAFAGAETAHRVKSAFLSNMSHVMRTPLHGILSFTGFCRRDLEQRDLDALTRDIDTIEECGRKLLELVERVLELAHLESGKMVFQFSLADPDQACRHAIRENTDLAQAKNLEICFQPLASLPPLCLDPDKIFMVFSHLVHNAIKFSPEGGRIEIRQEFEGDFIRYTVQDSGPGVPENFRESIFEKFSRAAPTGQGGGLGLGLALCREIVRGHGGEIRVEGNPSGGACFFFTLPLGGKIPPLGKTT